MADGSTTLLPEASVLTARQIADVRSKHHRADGAPRHCACGDPLPCVVADLVASYDVLMGRYIEATEPDGGL